MAKKPKPVSEFPYVVRDPYSMAGARWLVLGETFCGVRAVGYLPAHCPGPMVGTVDRVILSWHLPNYAKVEEISPLQSVLASIKEKMLKYGATPLAVEWIGALTPFSEKELQIMVDKLKTKGAGKASAAKAPKADKAAAPAKGKGNPEALAKAREASEGKRAELNAKKIKFVGKDVAVREGSIREELKGFAKSAKTVGELKDNTLSNGKNVSAGDVNWMIEAGIIEYA